jgi:lactate permease
MDWTQNYFPCGPVLSTLIAALPVVLLLGLLATGRVPAHLAALAGLVTAIGVAIFVFTPPEAEAAESGGVLAWGATVLAATANGAAFGLFPIGWIVLAAIFLYALTVETGQFEIVKHSVASLSADRRIQALLIAFCFGAFVEGAAGFGTPVAISAALLMGAGFRPLHAAGLALIANTSPVAFGALGTPITTLAKVTLPADIPLEAWEMQISRMAGRQLPFFSLLVPAWLVWTMAGWRGVAGVWPALLVCGGSFALVQFLAANFIGPALVDVAGGLISLAALALFLRIWQPAQTWQFPEEETSRSEERGARSEEEARRADRKTARSDPRSPILYSRSSVLKAWVPWLLLSLFVFLAGIPAIRDGLNALSSVDIPVPGLHEAVTRTKEVVRAPRPEEAVFKFNWLSATGTAIFLAALLSALWLRVAPRRLAGIFARTCYRMRWPLFTIACMLALAYVTRYSGMDATLGLTFTKTGWLYPFFAALLGWLGVALTGSDTSSNALFGSLQKITAEGLSHNGVLSLDPTKAALLLATANSTGGVMGKMIDAQSIVVSAAATQQSGQEGAILRFVFWHSLVLAALMGLLVMVQAYLWTAVIP